MKKTVCFVMSVLMLSAVAHGERTVMIGDYVGDRINS